MLTEITSTAGFKLYTCVPACLPTVNLQNSSGSLLHTHIATYSFGVYTHFQVNKCDTPEMHYIVTSKLMHKMYH